jgi:hypothetical protein
MIGDALTSAPHFLMEMMLLPRKTSNDEDILSKDHKD